MKALVLAAALAALSSTALAGAVVEHAAPDPSPVAVIADAGLSTATLTQLNDRSPWAGSRGTSTGGADFDSLAGDIAPGHLIVALCALGVALARPLGRLLRRQEQQRRANALASTLGSHGRG